MAMLKRLPLHIYVSIRGASKEEYLDANVDSANAIEEDGPTIVGTYRLIATNTLLKQVVVTKSARQKGMVKHGTHTSEV